MRTPRAGLVLPLTLMLAACAGEGSAKDLTGTSWLAAEIGGRAAVDGVETTLQFEADSRVAGSGGCNSYFGEVTRKGRSLSFGPLGSTRRACDAATDEQERRYFAALAQVARYEVEDGGLILFDAAGAAQVRLTSLTR